MVKSNWPTYIYLHGFASGPGSTKAQYFVSRLSDLNMNVMLPDLNGSSFRRLTLSNQLQIVRNCLASAEGDVVIIGSSMGGLLATLTAQECVQVKALVLLAPGFGLPRRWMEMLGEDGLETWRSKGQIEIFNHAMNRMAELEFDFIVDAEKYQTDGFKIKVPSLVFHGTSDATVPASESIDFRENNQELVELHLLDDGHELIEPLDQIWDTTRRFLHGRKLAPGEGFGGSNPF